MMVKLLSGITIFNILIYYFSQVCVRGTIFGDLCRFWQKNMQPWQKSL